MQQFFATSQPDFSKRCDQTFRSGVIVCRLRNKNVGQSFKKFSASPRRGGAIETVFSSYVHAIPSGQTVTPYRPPPQALLYNTNCFETSDQEGVI